MTAAPQHEPAADGPARARTRPSRTADELAWEALLSPDPAADGRVGDDGGAADPAGAAAEERARSRARRRARLSVDDLLGGLNPSQREAVVHEGAPVLVVAGA